MGDQKGRTAIVVGAGTGIGRAIALRFVEGGIGVSLAGRRPAPLEGAASQIRNRGGWALPVTADVADRTSVQDLVDRAVKRANVTVGAAYSASKFGIVSLTQSVNEELRELGIRACAICPGEVETPILKSRPSAPPGGD